MNSLGPALPPPNSHPSLQEFVALQQKHHALEQENVRLKANLAKLSALLDASRAEAFWFRKNLFGPKHERCDQSLLRQAYATFLRESGNRRPPAPQTFEPSWSTSGQLIFEVLLRNGRRGPGDAKPPTQDSPDPTGTTAGAAGGEPTTSGEPSVQPASGEPSVEPTASAEPPVEPSAAPSGSGVPKRPDRKRKYRTGRRMLVPDEVITEYLAPENVPEGAREVAPEVTTRFNILPARVQLIRIVRPTFIADHEDGSSFKIQEPPPPEMIEKGKFAPSFLAHIIHEKFNRQIPWFRQSLSWQRRGQNLSVSTISGLSIRAEPLGTALVDAMKIEARRLADVLAIDASTINILRGPKKTKAHFWVRWVPDLAAFVDFSFTHDSDVAADLLGGFDAKTLADGSNVYDRYHEKSGRGRAGCWSHARRKLVYASFTDEQALVGLRLIGDLFAIERDIDTLTPAKKEAERRRRSKPVVDQLTEWRDLLLADNSLPPQGLLAKALRYLRNQEERLRAFLTDGYLPIHNNMVELLIRHIALGRKNWLFIGSPAASNAASTWLSLILSARIHKLDPELYLRDIFRLLPIWPKNRLIELAPHCWRATRAQLDPKRLAAEFGKIAIPPPIIRPSSLGSVPRPPSQPGL